MKTRWGRSFSRRRRLYSSHRVYNVCNFRLNSISKARTMTHWLDGKWIEEEKQGTNFLCKLVSTWLFCSRSTHCPRRNDTRKHTQYIYAGCILNSVVELFYLFVFLYSRGVKRGNKVKIFCGWDLTLIWFFFRIALNDIFYMTAERRHVERLRIARIQGTFLLLRLRMLHPFDRRVHSDEDWVEMTTKTTSNINMHLFLFSLWFFWALYNGRQDKKISYTTNVTRLTTETEETERKLEFI